MKTRKVGRVLSVLLAIVMVVGLMIPASSVLAQNGVETLDESSFPGATWQEAKDFAELKAALDNAATDGSKTYIRLTGNIEAQSFTINSNGYYMGAVLDITGYYVPTTPVGDSTDYWKSASMSDMVAAMDSQVLTSAQEKYGKFNSALKTGGNPSFLLEHEMSGLDYFFEVFNTSDYEKYAYYMKYSPNDDEQTMVTQGKTMEDNTLVVRKNTDVVINFNGHTVSVKDGFGEGANVFTGNPNRMTSVFFVIGKLTVFGGGTITGGTGHVVGKVGVGESYNNVSTHKADWTYNRKQDNFFSTLTGRYTDRQDGEIYQLEWTTKYLYVKDAEAVRGGGVYLAAGSTFDMYDVKVTGNNAWYDNDKDGKATNVLKTGSGAQPDSRGGGVYVSKNATFNMHSGEISNNACRAYSKYATGASVPISRGGGVYLESGSTMNFTGGKILDNAVYSECNQDKSLDAQGGGIYVEANATLNMMGTADVTNDTNADIKNFPTVSGNSVAAYSRADAGSRTINLYGGGIYCAGTLNIRRAVVTANDFPECAVGNTLSIPDQSSVICVVRDEQTGLAEHDAFGNLVTTPNNYDITYNQNGYTAADADKRLVHAKSGKYGTGRGSSSMEIISNGAGVYIADTGKVVLGERTWIYDNYDLLTKGHKAFGAIRECERTAADVYGGYTYTATSQTTGGDSSTIDVKPGDGRTYSDTRDDIYLPEGKAFNVGESLFECKIGVNYYDMVGTGATKTQNALGANSNRVFVVSANDLDYDVWGTTSATPRPRDIQFFYLNDNNKEWEYKYAKSLPDYTKTTVSRVQIYEQWSLRGWSLKTNSTDNCKVWLTSERKTQAPVVKQNDGSYTYGRSYWEGYVNYNVNADEIAVEAGTPYYTYYEFNALPGTQTKLEYDNQTYYEGASGPDANYVGDMHNSYPSYPERYPNYKHLYEVVTTSITNPVYPQIAMEVGGKGSADLTGEEKAKYMDYKVIWDNDSTNGFATSETQPVLRFGSNEDRKMYATIDFSEANKTYFALTENKNLQTSNTVDSYSSTLKEYALVNGVTFDAANPVYSGSIEVGIPVPNYNIYKGNLLTNTVDGAITSITDEDGNFITQANVATAKEAPDLYFKNWSFYTSYGYGPETYLPTSIQGKTSDEIAAITVSKKVDAVDDFMLTRGTFNIDLSKIDNTNLNAQPCPTLTAMWYSQDELLEARKHISNVMVQRITKKDGTKAFRFMALVGSDYAEYDAAGFVYSLENATPTIEGGYKYTKATKIYKKMWTVNNQYPNGVWTEVSYLLDPNLSSSLRTNYKWNFLTSSFKDNLKMNNGYPVAGILYSDLDMTGIPEDAIIYVTPYLKKGNTYYYGESRGVSYKYAAAKDAATGSTEG